MKTQEEMEQDAFNEDDNDNSKLYDQYPKCYRDYDEIDYEYQICHYCGWDSENNKWT